MDILITVLDRYIRNGLMRSKSMDDHSLAEEEKKTEDDRCKNYG